MIEQKGARGWGILLAFFFSMAVLPGQFTVDTEVEGKIDELLEKMTLEEKVGQLNLYSSTFDVTGPPPASGANERRYQDIRSGLVGGMLNVTGAEATRRAQQLAVENSRLGIPLIFGFDVIHGYRTMLPIPLADAASWDMEAVEAAARVAASEGSAAGLHWTFAPMLDVSRDARWGRVMEGAGEDPYLVSRIAEARVRGFQGSDLSALDTVAACAKHFAGYGFVEAGRDYNTVDISERTLQEVVLPPFRAAVQAGVATVMNAFNEIGGVPATADSRLLREVLMGDWGFQGFVVSDWNSIGELVPHGVAADNAEAARLALAAGNHMDMETSAYRDHLVDLVRGGQVEERLVDDAVRRVLRVKFALGLFDAPYRYSDAEREEQELGKQEHLAVARDVARKSIVLLKNDDGLLPLDRGSGTLAVIGPLAADKDTPLGSWRGRAIEGSAVSLLEGIEAAVGPDVEVVHSQGAPLAVGRRTFFHELSFNRDDRSGFGAAVEAAREADRVVLALGEDAWQSGEGRSQVDIGLKGVQDELLDAVLEVNPNVVVVLMSGRPLAIPHVAERVPAILQTWHLGSQAGHAIADVLFGDYNPSGKLPVSFPRAVGQMPLYYNHKHTGRADPQEMVFWSHYTDSPNSPLFPFGHGLSYTAFDYSEIRLSSPELEPGGRLEVAVTVTNSGERAGHEVVQLYVRDLVGSVTRPVKELKGFEKIYLGPGQSREVVFTLHSEDLAFYTARETWEAEPGDFQVFVGTSSAQVKEAGFRMN